MLYRCTHMATVAVKVQKVSVFSAVWTCSGRLFHALGVPVMLSLAVHKGSL